MSSSSDSGVSVCGTWATAKEGMRPVGRSLRFEDAVLGVDGARGWVGAGLVACRVTSGAGVVRKTGELRKLGVEVLTSFASGLGWPLCRASSLRRGSGERKKSSSKIDAGTVRSSGSLRRRGAQVGVCVGWLGSSLRLGEGTVAVGGGGRTDDPPPWLLLRFGSDLGSRLWFCLGRDYFGCGREDFGGEAGGGGAHARDG